MAKYHSDGHMIKQDWLDRATFKELQNHIKKEKQHSKFFYMSIELAQIKCEDKKYTVLYYEKNAERVIQTIPTNEMFVVNDPELELDNIIELKHRKLEHSKQMGLLDMSLKPDTDNKNLLTKIVNYPVTQPLKRDEQALLWKYRYYLTQNKKALTKFLQCFDLNIESEGNLLMDLLAKWQPMDVEDALELLGPKYKNHPKIRSYAISRLQLAANEDLILYLLQLVQALRYENFALAQQGHLPTIQSLTTIDEGASSSADTSKTNSTTTSTTSVNNNTQTSAKGLTSSQQQQKIADDQTTLDETSADANATMATTTSNTNNASANNKQRTSFDMNLKTFLLQRATQDEIVALLLYWYVKVEIKDVKATQQTLNAATAAATTATTTASSQPQQQPSQQQPQSAQITGPTAAADSTMVDLAQLNFQTFINELLETLKNGDAYAKYIYEHIINQEKFLKHLNDIVKAVQREGGVRDKKVEKLRSFIQEQPKLLRFDHPVPLILDPSLHIAGINADKTTMFKSNLMPCKFVFKTTGDLSGKHSEYAVIYKIGDDLRQDQLVLQMIALMDKLLKQENLDLKLTPYKVIATGLREGFAQYIDALPLAHIFTNSEYKTIQNYLRKHNPSDTDRYGIAAEAMDNYVRSSAGYMVITWILGVGDRHYDNILMTKCGRIFHVDFGYILGRDPKPFQPTIKWTKEMADGMGGKYAPDGKENKEYEDFKKYCCNAFLHLRRHANLILNLFSLMVDANIPDIAIEPDKTVKKIMDRFKLEVGDEQALILLMKEIDSNYDTFVGSITDIIHNYNTAQK